MAEKIDPTLLSIRSAAGVAGTPGSQTAVRRPAPGQPDFAAILQAQQKPELRLSHHAEDRLRSRQIALSAGAWAKLEQAVDDAEAKGAQQSLILMDDLALVVNIRNRIVITALDKESRRSNVFTQIDSAVIT